MITEKRIGFASTWSEDSYRFKVGDKAKIVDRNTCIKLDNKFCNRRDHSFMAGKIVTIKEILKGKATLEPVYVIEEAEDYFWEDSFFKGQAEYIENL